jgi:dihydropteroate synthase
MPFPRRCFEVPLPGGRRLSLGPRTLVMAILNVTPDSFAEPAPRLDPDEAVDLGLSFEAQGADIIDVGGESTRPGAEAVPAEEEAARVLPVVRALAARLRVPLSIDTYKASVAARALDEGAAIVNDISGLEYDPELVGVVAGRGAAVVLMHNRGRSRAMYRDAVYTDVAGEVAEELAGALERARAGGVAAERVLLDPGLGFAKRPGHSYAALAGLPRLAALGRPLLVGPSRKSFLQAALGDCPPASRDWGTSAAVTSAILLGAHVVRVHAVSEMVQVARVADAVRAAFADSSPT